MSIFRCPLCSSSLQLVHGKSLQCPNRHCFDLAKQGYVNFLSAPLTTTYNDRLFSARSLVCGSGFYDPLHELISELIASRPSAAALDGEFALLDAGCGEGSHLARIWEKLNAQTAATVTGVGLDISKAGILLAAKQYPQLQWCVADLAHSPFHDAQFPVILNILSPANYHEFGRLLAADGLLLKVIPEQGYLRELRTHCFGQTDRAAYSNERVVNRFCERFALLERRRLQYKVALDHTLIESLVQMTPLTWQANAAALRQLSSYKQLEVSVDVTVLLGKALAR